MTRAAGLLLEATERDVGGGENRLTEILASVLQSSPTFASMLLGNVGLPSGDVYEVNTQVHIERRFIDMEVLALDSRGVVRARLWAEHKVFADFGPRQLQDYLDLLSRRSSGPRALVAIVREEALSSDHTEAADGDRSGTQLRPDPQEASSPPGSCWRTWQEIAILAADVGRRLGGRDWRRRVKMEAETASAAVLLLHELISVLERRELAFMDAIDTIDVTVIASAEEARDKIEALVERTLQHLEGTAFGPLPGKGKQGRSTRSIGSTWRHLHSPACWATERFGGWAEIQTRTDDTWKPDEAAMGVPCFGAGYTFEATYVDALVHGDALASWRAELEANDIVMSEDGGWLRCFGTLYLTQVVTSGMSLDDQAFSVAGWVEQTLQRIAAARPQDHEGER